MTEGRASIDREVSRSAETLIRYTVRPGDGPTLVLIHGWACNRNDYDAVIGQLPAGLRVIAVDLAEHGESRSTRDVWTMEEFAGDVVAVLDAESVDDCIVAGHSLGAAVAVEVGRLLPDRVSRVVALEGLHYLFLFGALTDEAAEELLRPVREDFPGLVRSMVEAGSPEDTDPALKDAYFEKMVAIRQPAGTRSFEGLVAWDMEEALSGVTQPISLFGVREMVSQEAIDRLGDRIDIELVDLGSHHFPTENPEGTAKLLAGLFAG